MSKIISIINYKGGVGKTSITFNLGANLSLHLNKKVLVIDLDPQTNLTFSMITPEKWLECSNNNGTLKSLYENYMMGENENFDLSRLILHSPVRKKGAMILPDMDLIPSHIGLVRIDVNLARYLLKKTQHSNKFRRIWEQDSILSTALASVKDDYDFILCDCPPNFNIVTQNAVFASDYYLIPTIPDKLSTLGINFIIQLIRKINSDGKTICAKLDKYFDPVKLLGIIFSKVKIGPKGPVLVHKNKIEKILNNFPDHAFSNYISESIHIPESIEMMLPVEFHPQSKKISKIREEFMKITMEFIDKIDKFNDF